MKFFSGIGKQPSQKQLNDSVEIVFLSFLSRKRQMITKQTSPRILELKVNKGLLFRLKRNGKYKEYQLIMKIRNLTLFTLLMDLKGRDTFQFQIKFALEPGQYR